MNREIKFRGWCIPREEMLDIQKMSFKFKKVMPNGWNMAWDDTNFEIMQYTGLTDNNGVDIFEGDIIEGGYLNPLDGGFTSKKYIIEYDVEKGGYMGHIIGYRPYGDTWIQFIDGIIIGNIYENKDLLK